MKQLLITLLVVLTSFSLPMRGQTVMTVNVHNSLSIERHSEMGEIELSQIKKELRLTDTSKLVVLNDQDQQVPYQITYDQKLIFPVTVKAKSTQKYTIKTGTPAQFPTRAYGRQFPERMDDMAWENDLVAFRAYGPTLQTRGEKAFGYDVFTKYNTPDPVLEARYANETSKEKRAKIAELKKTDPAEADRLAKEISYHVDHGNGMDCYAVGPTLGGGTSALMHNDTIVYPYCYKSYEILDNGPLRFTVKLVFTPLVVGPSSDVIETRIITLDAGSYLNKTEITYTHLDRKTPIATGLVLHEADGKSSTNTQKRFIAYEDPTTNPKGNNGKIYIGAVFPKKLKETKVDLFSEKERKELRGGAYGHVLAIGTYHPKETYTYYWGSAWNKAKIKTFNAWEEYLTSFSEQLRKPLKISIDN